MTSKEHSKTKEASKASEMPKEEAKKPVKKEAKKPELAKQELQLIRTLQEEDLSVLRL